MRMVVGQVESGNESRKQSAVLVIVYFRGSEPHLVFTKRTHRVAVHKGEVSFPGGAQEPCDRSLLDTALRETAEELGVDLRGAKIVAQLDSVRTTSSNFIVSPFVALVPQPVSFRPDPVEVEEVFDVPLSYFLEPQDAGEKATGTNDIDCSMPVYRYKGYTIWGATARILKQFIDLYKQGAITITDAIGDTPSAIS